MLETIPDNKSRQYFPKIIVYTTAKQISRTKREKTLQTQQMKNSITKLTPEDVMLPHYQKNRLCIFNASRSTQTLFTVSYFMSYIVSYYINYLKMKKFVILLSLIALCMTLRVTHKQDEYYYPQQENRYWQNPDYEKYYGQTNDNRRSEQINGNNGNDLSNNNQSAIATSNQTNSSSSSQYVPKKKFSDLKTSNIEDPIVKWSWEYLFSQAKSFPGLTQAIKKQQTPTLQNGQQLGYIMKGIGYFRDYFMQDIPQSTSAQWFKKLSFQSQTDVLDTIYSYSSYEQLESPELQKYLSFHLQNKQDIKSALYKFYGPEYNAPKIYLKFANETNQRIIDECILSEM